MKIILLYIIITIFLLGCISYQPETTPPPSGAGTQQPAQNETANETVGENETIRTLYPLTLFFIDVGQGDSIIIRYNESDYNYTVLVDGGDKSHGDAILSILRENSVKTVDLLVATHNHADHIGGLIQVVSSSIDFNIVCCNGVPENTQTYKDFMKACMNDENGGVVFQNMTTGDSLSINNLTIQVLAPNEEYNIHHNSGNDCNSVQNRNSVVFRLRFHNFTVLFTGDADFDTEDYILSNTTAMASISAGILKVGHHGSKTSTSEKFLDDVNPEVAVISVGANNRYGHPAVETLNRLESHNIEIYRTDLNGSIAISIMQDGDFVIHTENNRN